MTPIERLTVTKRTGVGGRLPSECRGPVETKILLEPAGQVLIVFGGRAYGENENNGPVNVEKRW